MPNLEAFDQNLDQNLEEVQISEFNEFHEMCPHFKYLPSIMKKVDRIIAIGDLHGDYKLTIKCLKLANLINSDKQWIGGNTVVVQIGDQIDRCRPTYTYCDNPQTTEHDEANDIRILKLFTQLNLEASRQGGAVYSLIGNHELMNIEGNLNYVSYEGLKQFSPDLETFKKGGYSFIGNIEGNLNKGFNKLLPDTDKYKIEQWKVARRKDFAIGSEMATFIACTRQSAIIIGDFLFVHAGIIPELVNKLGMTSQKDIKYINKSVRKWLLGQITKENISDIVGAHSYSMFWDRILGSIPPNMSNTNPACHKFLEPVLKILNIGHMIIGHTPQPFNNNMGINSTCSDSLWRVDHGGSGAFDEFDLDKYREHTRRPQVLEILNNKDIKILA